MATRDSAQAIPGEAEAQDRVLVAQELALEAAGAEVPDLDALVAAAHGDPVAIRREGHRVHGALGSILLHARSELPLLEVPDSHRAVQGARGQEDAASRKAHGGHRLQVAHQDLLHGAGGEAPDAHGVVGGGARQVLATWGPSDAVHPVIVAAEGEHSTAKFHVPHAYRLVPTARCHPRGAVGEGDRGHRKEVPLQRGIASAFGCVPDLDCLVGTR
mmetsp:Transcript_106213/g.342661  ORF Transcript_106213/g.342661 Transcript_106213/m.342661 type:complete len:216 (+) Transcript_106213:475-1122(+)